MKRTTRAVASLLAVLMHNSSGSIHRECEAALDAIERLQGSGFIPLAQDLFRTCNRQLGDLAAQRFARTVCFLLDLSLCRGHDTLALGLGVLLGLVNNLVGSLVRLIDDFRSLIC